MKKRILFFIFVALITVTMFACSGSSTQPKPQESPAPAPSTPPATQQLSLKITEPADESVVKAGSINLSGTVSTTAEITVNGTSVAVENGNFNAIVELEEGPNSLEIRATDGNGHEEIKVLTIVYLP